MSKIKPLYDRVLVERIETEQKTAGGIIIPDSAKEKTQIGTAVAVGEGRIDKDGNKKALGIKNGDKILFGKYSGTDVNIGEKEYLILKEDEVLGIVEG
jgi:chaperonin GroES